MQSVIYLHYKHYIVNATNTIHEGVVTSHTPGLW